MTSGKDFEARIADLETDLEFLSDPALREIASGALAYLRRVHPDRLAGRAANPAEPPASGDAMASTPSHA